MSKKKRRVRIVPPPTIRGDIRGMQLMRGISVLGQMSDGQPWTPAALQRETRGDYCERTIRRDLKLFETLGWVEYHAAKGGTPGTWTATPSSPRVFFATPTDGAATDGQ